MPCANTMLQFRLYEKIIYLMLLPILIAAVGASAQNTVEHGRETKMVEMDFTKLAAYLKAHPKPMKRQEIENEDDDERPVHTGGVDPSLVHYRTQSATHPDYLHLALMPVSPLPIDTFQAAKDTNSSVPPDTHGAVDSNYCVSTLNQTVRIQTRTGAIVSTMTLDGFWSPILPGGGSFDPRIHFDPYTNRWYIIAVSGAQTAQSSILLAISKTTDPTAGWYQFKVATYSAGTYWLDYPDVGFNKKWITVTGNLFSNASGAFLSAKLFVFNKALLLAGTSATYTAFTETTSFTICPAVTYDSVEPNMYCVESWDGTVAGGGQMQLWKISGAVGSEAIASVGFPASAGFNWQGQSNAVSGTAGADFAPQSGTANKIQTNDDRVTQVVFINGKLWFAHNVFLPYSTTVNPTRCSAQWWQIDTNANPLQLGVIDDPTAANFYAFPTIVANTLNDAFIGFTHFSTTSHPNCGYALHMHTDANDSLELPFDYRHGQATYYKTFGGSRDRWGDYSATMLDPNNLIDFWTIQECSSSTTNYYDTWWAYFKPCNPLAAPTAGVVPTTPPCQGTTNLYTVSAVTGASSYTWTVTGTGWNGTSLTDSANILAGSGIATISVVANSSCGSSAAYVFTVTSTPLPTTPVVTPPASGPCVGATSATYTAVSTGATTFNWSVSGTGWSGTSTTGSLNATVGTGTGQIIVYGSNACGNSAADTVNVTPSTGPGTPVVTLSGAIPCTGATTATYTATSTGATGYSWTVLGTGWSGTSTTASINVTLGTGAGTIICQTSDACGTGTPDTVTLTASPPAPTVSLVGAAPCFTSTTATYDATSLGATSFTWTVAGTGWTGTPTTTTDTLNLTVGSGTATVVCTANNGSGASTAVTTFVTPSAGIPAASPIFATGPICAGSVVTFITSGISGASSYVWTVSGAGWSGTSTTTLITVNVGYVPATISVYGVGPCGAGASYTLDTVWSVIPPTSTFSIANHVVGVGTGDLVTYTGTASASGTYSWNFGGGTAVPGIGVGPHTVTWGSTGLKTLTLSVTDTGCTSVVYTDTVLVVTTTGMENVAAENEDVAIVPNPNAGTFDILFAVTVRGSAQVKILDEQGRVVYTGKFENVGRSIPMNLGMLPNALYTATIITDGAVINKKVVVSR